MSETATFALGCFWGPDDFFSKLPGVIKTRVGYAGGTKEHPTYHDLGDHTESIEIEFDNTKISYEELLEHFFTQHDPTAPQKTQYKSIVFYWNDAQRKAAQESKERLQQELRRPIQTEITRMGTFYGAEDYHQKYLAKACRT